jgi:hypothetical protein
MEYAAYLRDQAARYRELAGESDDAGEAQELLELAAVCEHVALAIEEGAPSG